MHWNVGTPSTLTEMSRYYFIVLQNMAALFPAYSGRVTNYSIYGSVESGWQAVNNKLNLAQITAQVRGAILARGEERKAQG